MSNRPYSYGLHANSPIGKDDLPSPEDVHRILGVLGPSQERCLRLGAIAFGPVFYASEAQQLFDTQYDTKPPGEYPYHRVYDEAFFDAGLVVRASYSTGREGYQLTRAAHVAGKAICGVLLAYSAQSGALPLVDVFGKGYATDPRRNGGAPAARKLLLEALVKYDSLTQIELAASSGILPTETGRILADMQEKGIVTKKVRSSRVIYSLGQTIEKYVPVYGRKTTSESVVKYLNEIVSTKDISQEERFTFTASSIAGAIAEVSGLKIDGLAVTVGKVLKSLSDQGLLHRDGQDGWTKVSFQDAHKNSLTKLIQALDNITKSVDSIAFYRTMLRNILADPIMVQNLLIAERGETMAARALIANRADEVYAYLSQHPSATLNEIQYALGHLSSNVTRQALNYLRDTKKAVGNKSGRTLYWSATVEK